MRSLLLSFPAEVTTSSELFGTKTHHVIGVNDKATAESSPILLFPKESEYCGRAT